MQKKNKANLALGISAAGFLGTMAAGGSGFVMGLFHHGFLAATIGGLAEILHGPSRRPDGTMNLVGALRRAMATTGYSDLKEFQRVDLTVSSGR